MPDSSPYAFGPIDRGHFTNPRGKRLYRSLHVAAGSPRRVWVFCNALLEDATFGFRTLAELADAVARSGDAALRFDVEGQGDSEGTAELLGLADWADDTVTAVNWARKQLGAGTEVVMVGMGSGAFVAARAAAMVDASRLLLIDPVADGRAHFAALLHGHTTIQLSCFNRVRESAAQLQQRLRRGQTVSLMGHEVGEAFATTLQAADLSVLLASYGRRTDLIAVCRPTRPQVEPAVQALALQPDVRLHTCEVHSFLDPELRYWELPPALRELCLLTIATDRTAA